MAVIVRRDVGDMRLWIRPMRVRLIVNPRSSGTDDALVARVVGVLARTCEFELAPTRAAGHATELAGSPVPTRSLPWVETAPTTRW